MRTRITAPVKRWLEMQSIVAGDSLVKLVEIACRANLPVLLHGMHGIGKSAVMAEAARVLRIDFIELDLSIMEPPDLTGIPHIGSDGRTQYAAPDFLPKA